MMTRTAKAIWKGNGKEGTGTITSGSGVLSEANYGFKTRFENGPGTNPEELIAAAHAGCFAMALAFQLQANNFTPAELACEAAVTLEKDGDGLKVSRSALTLSAQIPGIDKTKFDELAAKAKAGCPISKLLNAEITLDATLR